MPRANISPIMLKKLTHWYAKTLDLNNDGLVTWPDFEAAIENMVPKQETEKNSRLLILRKRVEQHFQKYFWDLCAVGDANKDGNIDLDEWLDVMDDIIAQLKQHYTFPEWYEGLHKALFRSNEFLDDRNISKDEFCNMLMAWNIDDVQAEKAFDFMTKGGTVHMDYNLFSDMMKKFMTTDEKGHPINMGLDG